MCPTFVYGNVVSMESGKGEGMCKEHGSIVRFFVGHDSFNASYDKQCHSARAAVIDWHMPPQVRAGKEACLDATSSP